MYYKRFFVLHEYEINLHHLIFVPNLENSLSPDW